jgi:hypothetical protein
MRATGIFHSILKKLATNLRIAIFTIDNRASTSLLIQQVTVEIEIDCVSV